MTTTDHRSPHRGATARTDRPPPARRHHALAWLTLLTLSACATPPPAPPMLYLPSEAPATTAGMPRQASTAPVAAWRLVTPVQLPAALDRDAVMVASSAGQWLPWQGLRWVEPLRDAVPRVLLADLSALHGGVVWTGRIAPGAEAPLALHIAIDEWEASLPQREVRLVARWSLSPPGAAVAQAGGQVRVRTPWPVASAEGLSQAHRAALAALAAQIVAQAGRSTGPAQAIGTTAP